MSFLRRQSPLEPPIWASKLLMGWADPFGLPPHPRSGPHTPQHYCQGRSLPSSLPQPACRPSGSWLPTAASSTLSPGCLMTTAVQVHAEPGPAAHRPRTSAPQKHSHCQSMTAFYMNPLKQRTCDSFWCSGRRRDFQNIPFLGPA